YTVTVTVRDDDGGVRSDTLLITVKEPIHNGRFKAHEDRYRIAEDHVLIVDSLVGVLANDRGPAGSTLRARVVQDVHHGTLLLNADGAFVYTPHANFFGQDRFWYEFTDGITVAKAARVKLTITPVNDTPVNVADVYMVTQGTTLRVRQAEGLLANDTDVDGDHLKARLVSGPAHGKLDLEADGTFTYKPQAGFTGTDAFVYQADDRHGGRSAPTLVTLTVALPPAPAPCAPPPVVIDWDGSQREKRAWLSRLTPKPAAWLPRFLLDLGRSEQERDPNRGLEIALPGKRD
ncbi:MAG: tandem-95 repeat protein, partial [Nitrospirota bacterium]|nr:tandem-95 repeat protein [Nitrospirota bacterium]